MCDRVPPPSERIFEQECQALRDDVAVFVEMLRVAAPAWVRTELAFPEGGAGEIEIDLGTYSIRVQGTIDRVDEPAPGRFVVIDYKTGSPRRYRVSAPFDGGRRIQHVVYLLAAEQMLGGEATAMQYHFPTVTGERRVVEYPREVATRGRQVLRTLIDGALEGLFVATDDASDCAYCDFAPICRARKNDYGKVTSPAAAWSKETGAKLPEYRYLNHLRASDAAVDPA
jgi:ATP-dependent helicase/nuclease subunit B